MVFSGDFPEGLSLAKGYEGPLLKQYKKGTRRTPPVLRTRSSCQKCSLVASTLKLAEIDNSLSKFVVKPVYTSSL